MNRQIFLITLLVCSLYACSEKTTASSRAESDNEATQAGSSPTGPEGIRYSGKGTIGEYKITWTLMVSSTEISGTYQYDGQEAALRLTGSAQQNVCSLTELDPDGKITGHWRMEGFPDPIWRGSWKKKNRAGADSLFVTLTADEAMIFSSADTYPEEGLQLESKEVSLYSPDSMCQVVHSLWRAPGREDLARAYNSANPPPSFQNRSVGLTDCIEAREEAGEVARDYPPSGEESTVSLGIPFNGILPVHTDYYEYYAGAAHGNYGQFTKHLWLADFSEIGLDKLFTGNFREVIGSQVEEGLIRQYGSDGPVEEFEGLSDNFHYELHPDQLVVYFNPYEIGAYVLGQIRVSIPYAEISEVIREDGPLNNAGS